MTDPTVTWLANEQATIRYGERLGASLSSSLVYLSGPLGAGKTTMVRGALRGLGFDGTVKSPTYTLIEPYYINGREIYHLDFYRINDPIELEYIGLEDVISDSICFVEWPSRSGDWLPPPDMELVFYIEESGRRLELFDYRK